MVLAGPGAGSLPTANARQPYSRLHGEAGDDAILNGPRYTMVPLKLILITFPQCVGRNASIYLHDLAILNCSRYPSDDQRNASVYNADFPSDRA